MTPFDRDMLRAAICLQDAAANANRAYARSSCDAPFSLWAEEATKNLKLAAEHLGFDLVPHLTAQEKAQALGCAGETPVTLPELDTLTMRTGATL
jgi:hypothetical protein